MRKQSPNLDNGNPNMQDSGIKIKQREWES